MASEKCLYFDDFLRVLWFRNTFYKRALPVFFSSHIVDNSIDCLFFLEHLLTVFINFFEIYRAFDYCELLLRLHRLYLLFSKLIRLLSKNPIQDQISEHSPMVFHLESRTLISYPDFGAQQLLGKILIERTHLKVARNNVVPLLARLLWRTFLINPLEIRQQIHKMFAVSGLYFWLYVVVEGVISYDQRREGLI